jgi:hypothetical protein
MCDFKKGDYIYKLINNELDRTHTLYKILDIKERKGSNWHDGNDITFIATLLSQDIKTEYSNTEEYDIQYTNKMCLTNIKHATIVDVDVVFDVKY